MFDSVSGVSIGGDETWFLRQRCDSKPTKSTANRGKRRKCMHDQRTSIQVENPCSARSNRGLERMTGIEPAFSAWEARLTVLSYPPDITTESV